MMDHPRSWSMAISMRRRLTLNPFTLIHLVTEAAI